MEIIVINPGATSTKVGLYKNDQEVFIENIRYKPKDLQNFSKVNDQLFFRLESILKVLEKNNVKFTNINGIAARGGLLPPVESGAYEINDRMVDFLTNHARVEHASNLGAILAKEILKLCPSKTKAYVYDPVTVDQFEEISRISGLKGIERISIGHALNMRAVAMHIAKEKQCDYEQSSFIVAHLGGGNTISVHKNGRMIDSLSDDEGPFSTERTGELPVKSVIKWCYQYSQQEMERMRRQTGGVYSYIGTNDMEMVEKMIAEGNKEAELIFNALCYQVAKGIGALATVLKGHIDGIILTGGLVYSEKLVKNIKQQVDFLGEVYVVPGEREMYALASGISRVLNGKEKARIF